MDLQQRHGKKHAFLMWICTADVVLVRTDVDVVLFWSGSPSSVTPVKRRLPIGRQWHQLIKRPSDRSSAALRWRSEATVRRGRAAAPKRRLGFSQIPAAALLPLYQHGLNYIICKALKTHAPPAFYTRV